MQDNKKVIPFSDFRKPKGRVPRTRGTGVVGSPFLPLPEGVRIEVITPRFMVISLSPEARASQGEKWRAFLLALEAHLIRYEVFYELLLERNTADPHGPRIPDAIKIALASKMPAPSV